MSKDLFNTPLMKQYAQIKAKHPDAILLFRVGDFYETYSEDAIKAAKILNITLTKKSSSTLPIEMAGFPFHAIDTYLPKLVRAGQRVAICEQLEDPKLCKTLVNAVLLKWLRLAYRPTKIFSRTARTTFWHRFLLRRRQREFRFLTSQRANFTWPRAASITLTN